METDNRLTLAAAETVGGRLLFEEVDVTFNGT